MILLRREISYLAAGIALILSVSCVDEQSAPVDPVKEWKSPPSIDEGDDRQRHSGPYSTLITNFYKVPPDFLESSLFDPDPPGSRDPFADPPSENPEGRKTIRDVLEGAGIHFGTGSSALYLKGTSQVAVRNTDYQMEQVERFFEILFEQADRNVAIRLEIFEGTRSEISKILNEIEPFGDQLVSYERITKLIDQGEVSREVIVNSVVKPGEVLKSFVGVEEGIVKDYRQINGDWNPEIRKVEIGTSVEVRALIPLRPETIDLELNLRHHFGTPTIRKIPKRLDSGEELFVEDLKVEMGKLISRISINEGQTRLLGSWPVNAGNDTDSSEGRMQVVFAKVEVWKSGG